MESEEHDELVKTWRRVERDAKATGFGIALLFLGCLVAVGLCIDGAAEAGRIGHVVDAWIFGGVALVFLIGAYKLFRAVFPLNN